MRLDRQSQPRATDDINATRHEITHHVTDRAPQPGAAECTWAQENATIERLPLPPPGSPIHALDAPQECDLPHPYVIPHLESIGRSRRSAPRARPRRTRRRAAQVPPRPRLRLNHHSPRAPRRRRRYTTIAMRRPRRPDTQPELARLSPHRDHLGARDQGRRHNPRPESHLIMSSGRQRRRLVAEINASAMLFQRAPDRARDTHLAPRARERAPHGRALASENPHARRRRLRAAPRSTAAARSTSDSTGA